MLLLQWMFSEELKGPNIEYLGGYQRSFICTKFLLNCIGYHSVGKVQINTTISLKKKKILQVEMGPIL